MAVPAQGRRAVKLESGDEAGARAAGVRSARTKRRPSTAAVPAATGLTAAAREGDAPTRRRRQSGPKGGVLRAPHSHRGRPRGHSARRRPGRRAAAHVDGRTCRAPPSALDPHYHDAANNNKTTWRCATSSRRCSRSAPTPSCSPASPRACATSMRRPGKRSSGPACASTTARRSRPRTSPTPSPACPPCRTARRCSRPRCARSAPSRSRTREPS